jgi:hypothetical protein
MNFKKLSKSQLVTLIYSEVFGDITLDTKHEQNNNIDIINDCINFDCATSVTDTLYGMFKNGPLYDGDVCSKQGRDRLLDKDYCAKVVVKGQDGFNACTYKGQRLYKCLKVRFAILNEQRRISIVDVALRDLLTDCINFDGAKLSDCKMKQASDALKLNDKG